MKKNELIEILKNKNAEKLLAGFIRYRPTNDGDYCFCSYIRIINTKTLSDQRNQGHLILISLRFLVLCLLQFYTVNMKF